VLLIGNDADIRDTVTALLTAEGHEVVAVGTVQGGLAVAGEWRPGIILLDRAGGLANCAFLGAYLRLPGPHASIAIVSPRPGDAGDVAHLGAGEPGEARHDSRALLALLDRLAG
jgi:DNA-binding response OmpR family regulator